MPPQWRGKEPGGEASWQPVNREVGALRLAGRAGISTSDTFSNGRLHIVRQIWVADGGDAVAFRHRVTNRMADAIRLDSINPLHLAGPDGLHMGGSSDLRGSRILVQERDKNGKPRAVAPGSATGFAADPCFLLSPADEGKSDLLVGYLSQGAHLARINVAFTENSAAVTLDALQAECQFDGILLPPGGERSSQWVIVMSGDGANDLMASFADRVGDYHRVPPPPPDAPSVFCTWYFHGANYNQTFLQQDLAALRQNRIPFDVFLIDDCWANGNWGYWDHGDAFPDGMAAATRSISELGYQPGIWTAPYSVNMDSKLAKEHPEWLLKYRDGTRVVFGYAVKAWILDPTYPGVVEHLERLFRRLAEDEGFSYFKCDFMRSVYVFDDVVFHDPTATRLEAYTRGLEAIRRGIGPKSYLSICGGHYGGSLGIADSQRSGSDVVSLWEPDQIDSFRQNFLRTWMSRLWHVDPDALMIRRRDTPYHDPNDKESRLALGRLTDTEAQTFTLNQYLGGGMVCISEYLPELQKDRRAMLRHVIPSINSPSWPLDGMHTLYPAWNLTKVDPVAPGLEGWRTLSFTNWGETPAAARRVLESRMVDGLRAKRFLVTEFFGQKILGLYAVGEAVDLGIVPPHESRLLRIAPWTGVEPVLAGTDLHFSGGGVEIASWWKSDDGQKVRGEVQTEWRYPMRVQVAFPADNAEGYVLASAELSPGQRAFAVQRPAGAERRIAGGPTTDTP